MLLQQFTCFIKIYDWDLSIQYKSDLTIEAEKYRFVDRKINIGHSMSAVPQQHVRLNKDCDEVANAGKALAANDRRWPSWLSDKENLMQEEQEDVHLLVNAEWERMNRTKGLNDNPGL